MSSLILPATAPPPLSAAPPPFLTPRNYIPPHVYKHPAAILLELCTSVKELHQFIPLVIKNGLYGEHLFQTKIVSLFCKFGRLNDALKVFEPIESKTDPIYHTLLKGYVQQDTMINAYKFFCRMKCDSVAPVVYNFTYLLKACADSFDAKRGKEIHAQLILNGFSSNLFAMTSVVNLKVIHGSDSVGSARKEIVLWFPDRIAEWTSSLHP
ncbi:unnamed protein product [Fraxinus pennsylvanica]|uniref:Pentatricopeptide repeat-containing protein n=1 Tax=Fraxinus pennsylvanica TaxID=56036 RepID=A0AAD1ZNQ1_9LAMI|nr:unnamed protein product [Fraxinus pennsylvanica]